MTDASEARRRGVDSAAAPALLPHHSVGSVPLVRARDVGVRVGAADLLRHVSIDIPSSAEVAVVGRSGSGKTSLLLTLAGLLPVTSGRVDWPGLHPDPAVRRHQVGVVFQAPSLMPELTAAENVALPLRLQGLSVGDAWHRARVALAAVGLSDAAAALPPQLSGGQAQRVAIARVLARRHRLVLADEPSGALDRAHAHRVVQVLRDGVAAVGGTLVLATHDPELAALLHAGVTVDDGTVAVHPGRVAR